MSKSDPNPNSRILITDDGDTIRRKLRTALTDSIAGISYDPQKRPGVSNLLDIFCHCTNNNIHNEPDELVSSTDLAIYFKDSTLRSLKEATADAVIKKLKGPRERFLQLQADSPKDFRHDLETNRLKASSIANDTMLAVKAAMGLRPIVPLAHRR